MDKLQLNRLLEKIRDGDMGSFENLYVAMYKPICSIAYAILQDSHLSEDIAQETFIIIGNKIQQYNYPFNPFAWIYSITRNLALTVKQRTKIEITDDEFLINKERSQDNVEDGVINKEFLKSLFSQLDEDERQIIFFYLVSGLKHREIAALMNIPIGTELSKYHRALKKVKKIEEGEKGFD